MFNILVVDDDSLHRFLLIRLLKELDSGYWVFFEAEDGREALQILKNISVDAVFTDIRMPNISGLELLQNIKKLNENLHVILVSSYSEFNYVKEGLVLGAFDYILKPLDKKILTKVITRLKDSIQNKRRKKEAESILLDKYDLFYLNQNVSKLVDLLPIDKDRTIHYAIDIFETLCNLHSNNSARLSYAIQAMIKTIIYEIEEKYPWIHNYHYFHDDSSENFRQNVNKDYLLSKVIKIIDDFSCIISNLKLVQSDLIIKQLCEYIALNSDKRITLHMSANKFNFNSDYLGKLFKLKTGENFNNYVTRVKMERAKYLLSLHKYKIYEIAIILGYKDSDYFSKLFTKYIGQSPNSYKNRELINIEA